METVQYVLSHIKFVVLHLVFIYYDLGGDGVKDKDMQFLTKKYIMMTQKRCFYCMWEPPKRIKRDYGKPTSKC